MSREFSREVIGELIEGTSWTREIPLGVLKNAMPNQVTPAHTSDEGRCPPVFNLWDPISRRLCSIHVSRQKRNPHSYKLTTGKTNSHVVGVTKAVEQGLSIPVICFNRMDTDDWFRMSFDAGEILREHPPRPASWGPSPVTLNTTYRRSGAGYREYRTIRINYASCGLKWEPILEPEFSALI